MLPQPELQTTHMICTPNRKKAKDWLGTQKQPNEEATWPTSTPQSSVFPQDVLQCWVFLALEYMFSDQVALARQGYHSSSKLSPCPIFCCCWLLYYSIAPLACGQYGTWKAHCFLRMCPLPCCLDNEGCFLLKVSQRSKIYIFFQGWLWYPNVHISYQQIFIPSMQSTVVRITHKSSLTIQSLSFHSSDQITRLLATAHEKVKTQQAVIIDVTYMTMTTTASLAHLVEHPCSVSVKRWLSSGLMGTVL